MPTPATLFNSTLGNMELLSRGKVRDIYDCGNDLLLITSDRISAFDVVMPNPIPGKGRILNQMSAFWFEQMGDIIPSHVVSLDVEKYPAPCRQHAEVLAGRSMIVKKAKPLPVECIVRGYISGSGWNDYLSGGVVSGIKLPVGLKESERLSEPLFTPSTKADIGEHDMPITFTDVENLIGAELSAKIRDVAITIYERAAAAALRGGIIIADTKMEFGIHNDELFIIDELLTPDSSRFWPLDDYAVGRSQKSFDKQFLRDYLLSVSWGKTPPAPELPEEIITQTSLRYQEAYRRIVGERK